MSDLGFEALLAEHNQSFKDAREFSDWMPPDDKYIVTIIKCDKGVFEGNQGWWKLTARIEKPEDGKLNGQEFSAGFYSTKNLGMLKQAARVLNNGATIDSLALANDVMTKAVGTILNVEIITTQSRKDGKEYTNCRMKEVIPVQMGDNTTPPQEDIPF